MDMRCNVRMTQLPSIRISVRALLIQDHRVLLSKYAKGSNVWYVTPGGGMVFNEFITEGLKREVLEETGYHVIPGAMVSVREVLSDRMETCNIKKSFHQIELFCKARLVDDTEQAIPHEMDEDQVGCEWVSLDALEALNVYPKNLGAIIKQAMLISDDQPCCDNAYGVHGLMPPPPEV